MDSSEFGELPALASPWQTGTTKDLRDTTQTVPRELRTAQSSQMCPEVSQRRWDNEERGHSPRAEHPLPARAGADPPPAPTFPLTPTTAHPKAWDQTSGGIWGAPGQSLAQLLPPHLGIPNPSTITYNIQSDFAQRGFLLESSSGRCPGLGTQGRKERSQGSIPGKAPNAAWLYLGQRRHGRCSRAH